MSTGKGNYGYSTRQVVEKLKVTRSKLRRLTLALEKHGYHFPRKKSNQRIYFEQNVQMISQLMLEMKKGKTIDYAAAELCGGPAGLPQAELTKAALHSSGSGTLKLPETEISFSAEQFRLMIEQVAATAAEKTAENVIERYDREMERRIERRDRELVNRLREASEAGVKKNNFFSRFIGRKKLAEKS
ncbi:hypothetical protein [Sporolactobacillus sp. THM19-2]|jgi:hypothetical protein|uniref:hypothetical protein n=1 Tax=Sporolactobacillus sp. THM19-2 TaxID=2511171 RepID=UPI0010229F01|nr:hypothetical protein [Sporolactobacillus sp. THM19-2]RYL93301.1 hypothetical protein EWH91_05515 [Sporolactobacillus sp. THM19-2]